MAVSPDNTQLLNVFSAFLNLSNEYKNRYTDDNRDIITEHLKSIDVKTPSRSVLCDAIDFWVEKGKFPTIDDLATLKMESCHCPYIVMGENKEVYELYKQYIIKTIKDGQDLSCTITMYAFIFYMHERRFPSYDELRTLALNTLNTARDNFMNEPVDKHWVPGKVETVEKIKKECSSVCENEDGEKCSICYDDIKKGDKIIILNCKHKFHFGKDIDEKGKKDDETDDSCAGIFEWLRKNNTCPICKSKID